MSKSSAHEARWLPTVGATKRPMRLRSSRVGLRTGFAVAICGVACLVAAGCGASGPTPSGSPIVPPTISSGTTIAPAEGLPATPPAAPTRAPATAGPPPKAAAPPPAPGANAAPGQCAGTIGAVAVTEVNVPDGATCILEGTTIDSNVSIGVGATLRFTDMEIGGDVEADRANSVEVTGGSTVGGDLQLQERGFATLGYHAAQGYFYAHPLTVAEAETLLRDGDTPRRTVVSARDAHP
jgi:hypothetical protein